MCPRCRRYYLPKWTWKHTSARWRKDKGRDGNRHRPFRAVDANKATLALLRHNERVDQQGQRQSKAEGSAAAKRSQAQVDQPSRQSPQTTARLAKAATARGAEAQEPDAATTSFSRIHAAVEQLNAQRHATTVDGLSSICNASSETRLHEGNLNRLARELDPHRIVHNPFMDAESETFERPRTKGAAADSGRHAGNADDRGLGPSADNGGDQGADSSSREVSDAEAEDALPLATP